MPEFEYDVFISYAREELDWVSRELYEPLLRCRTQDNRVPRIFFDVAAEGVQAGESFVHKLGEAIRRSRKLVAVYSELYFTKEMCKWELEKCCQLGPTGERRILIPILREPTAAQRIPFHVNHIQYEDTSRADWFERLCVALELSPTAERAVLQFVDPPAQEVVAGHTWLPLRVALAGKGQKKPRDDDITLRAETGELHGSLTVRAKEGIATFADLSVGPPTGRVNRLIASARGYDDAFSEPFSVVAATVLPPSAPRGRIRAKGEVIFFSSGEAFVTVDGHSLRAWTIAGDQLGEPILVGHPCRLIRRRGPVLALADWSGGADLFFEDGRHFAWSWSTPEHDLVVPGGMVIEGEGLLIGFWSGALYRWTPPESPQLVLTHEPGIQALERFGEHLLIVGLDGDLVALRNGETVARHRLERPIHLLKAYTEDGPIVAVGDTMLYCLDTVTEPPVPETPISGTAAVLGDSDCPLVIDSQGLGVRFDRLLAWRWFRTVPGARPVCADNSGQYSVLLSPDGSHSLLREQQIVFTHSGGTLAVAPAGNRFALGDDQGIRILDADDLDAILQGGPRG